MMQDDLERKQKQSQEDKCHQSVEDTQVNEDMMERSVGARIKGGRGPRYGTKYGFDVQTCLDKPLSYHVIFKYIDVLPPFSILCTVEPLTFFFSQLLLNCWIVAAYTNLLQP